MSSVIKEAAYPNGSLSKANKNSWKNSSAAYSYRNAIYKVGSVYQQGRHKFDPTLSSATSLCVLSKNFSLYNSGQFTVRSHDLRRYARQ